LLLCSSAAGARWHGQDAAERDFSSETRAWGSSALPLWAPVRGVASMTRSSWRGRQGGALPGDVATQFGPQRGIGAAQHGKMLSCFYSSFCFSMIWSSSMVYYVLNFPTFVD
jgi:hypothetical protein